MPGLREYIVGATGCVVGLYLGGIAGGLMGAGIGSLVLTSGGLETLGTAVLGLLLGALAGAGLGCWVALRLIRAARAGTTGLLASLLLAALVLAFQLLLQGAILRAASPSPALLSIAAALLARPLTFAFVRRSRG